MSEPQKYYDMVSMLNEKWGGRAERYIFLFVAFFCSWTLFIPLLLIHVKIVGLKRQDKDLVTFYLPIMVFLAAMFFLMLTMSRTILLLFAAPLFVLVGFALWGIILFDVYKFEFEDRRITFDLIDIDEKLFLREDSNIVNPNLFS